MSDDKIMARFWPKVQRTDGCWLWTASRNNIGYGVFSVSGLLGYAHRFSYETFIGPIPEGFEVDHLCNVRNCVRPEHLEPVTPAENKRRRSERQLTCIRGHVRAGNTYTRGQCKPCVAARKKERAAA